MTRIPQNVSDADLDRFVDDRLDPDRRAEIAAYLGEHSDIAAEVEAQVRLNALLGDRYAPVFDEPVPAALLRATARSPAAGRPAVGRMLRTAAALLLAVGLGGFGGWMWRDSTLTPPAWTEFVHQAASAHRVYAPEAKRSVEITAAREKQLLAWLSRRIGVRIEAPALSRVGFRLIGGRLLPSSEGPAAQLMYENAAGKRITLYLRTDLRNTRDVAFQAAREREVNVWYWLEGARGYALAGEIDRRELLRIAEVLYDEIGS